MNEKMQSFLEKSVKAVITKYGGIVNYDCWNEIATSFADAGLMVLHTMGIHCPQN